MCGIDICTLMHASSTMGLKFTATIEGGSRHKNIVNLGEFLYGILIGTSDHHLFFCGENERLDSLTPPQLMGGMRPSNRELKHESILT